MTQIPRKPTFPLHMIQKLLAKIQSDVNDDVIPVSTGIYSYEKLKNKLQAISKPEIQNYDDKIFFQVIQDRLSPPDKTGEKCPSCQEEYNMKKNAAIMCNFCALWCCNNCMPVRKRPHPLSKDANGKRYNICQRCDTKFLNLQLSHSYVQNRTLLEQAIAKTSQQLEEITNQCKQYQEVVTKSKQTFEKNKFKIAQLKKEKLQLNKDIKTKMPQQIKNSERKTQELKQRFIEVHLQHKQWLQMSQSRKKIWEQEKQQHRIQRQQREKQQQERENLRRQKQREQQQWAERIQKEKKQAQQKERQRQREISQQKLNKLKKAPSLSQNLTFNMSLSYNGQSKIENDKALGQEKVHIQKVQQNHQNQTKIRKMSIENEHIDVKVKNQKPIESRENIQQKINHETMRQSEVFREYFTDSNQQIPEGEDEYFSHKYKTSNKKIFDESEQKQLNQQKESLKDKKEVYVSNFTFNQKIIDQLKPQQTTWHYNEKQRKKSQNIQNIDEPQFTFDQKKQQQKELQETKIEIIQPITKNEKIQSPQNNEEQDNHLSFVDEWYVNKQNKFSQNQSTLSSVLNNQSYERTYFNTRKNKTPQELEQECTKSTSQLDQQQLQVARYSLLKTARDSAVQEREKNKIYQRSVHEIAPYDEEQEIVGEVKKCQCSIY